MKYITLLFGILVIGIQGKSQTANELYEKAMSYKAKDNFTEAAKLLSKALEQEPNNKSYLTEFANAQYQKRAYYDVIPVYENLLKDDEENLTILTRLAAMYSMSPQKLKGVEYAERAMKLKPTDGETNKLLARTFLEVNHFPKAIKLYKMAEEALPEDKDIPFKIANCYEHLSDYENAMLYSTKAMNLDPDNASKIYEAANSCFEANKFNKAVELYQLAEDKGFNKSKAFYENWAASYDAMMDYKMALFYYTKAKDYSPYEKYLNMSIADVYVKMQKFEKAREVLDELLEINPKDPEVLYNKGMTYYKAGNTSKAESYFNQAFELDPSLKSLRYTKSNF